MCRRVLFRSRRPREQPLEFGTFDKAVSSVLVLLHEPLRKGRDVDEDLGLVGQPEGPTQQLDLPVDRRVLRAARELLRRLASVRDVGINPRLREPDRLLVAEGGADVFHVYERLAQTPQPLRLVIPHEVVQEVIDGQPIRDGGVLKLRPAPLGGLYLEEPILAKPDRILFPPATSPPPRAAVADPPDAAAEVNARRLAVCPPLSLSGHSSPPSSASRSSGQGVFGELR